MKELNLTAKTKEQELVKSYFQNNASEILADKINNGVRIFKDNKELVSKKDLDGFFSYANNEAQKISEKGARSACIEDNTVYGWAIHYFEEDSIEGNLYNLDGSEYKAVNKVQDRTPTKQKLQPKNKENAQPTLFDLMESPQEMIKEQSSETDDNLQEELTQQEIDEILREVAEQENKQKGSPLYRRYMTVQNAYPNSIVCMRLGDFYEFFGESAKTISSELDLTLTTRDCSLEVRTPMCGIPYHAADNYFGKIRQNHNLVVIESNKDSKTIYLAKFENITQQSYENIDIETGEILNVDSTTDNEIISKLKNIFGNDMEVRL